MAKKKKVLPDEIQQIVEEVRQKEHEEDVQEARELVQQYRTERANSSDYWDIKKEDPIEVFDPLLSYEITGYRPITKTQGLDFNPEWFIKTRKEFEKTGKYCQYLPGSKRYDEFWREQYIRCKYGMTVNGYTITGDNYFFLNFYQLPIVDEKKASGAGLNRGFPKFFESHYRFFHYLQLAREVHKHAVLMKARSIGFSEIDASLSARMYTIIRNSRTMITCHNDNFLKGTFSKADSALTFLNSHTQGGMFQPRLVDKELEKKSGYQEKVNGQFEDFGFKSTIIGINGNKPSNIRGDRVDLLIYDEAGCHAPGTQVIMYDGTLKNVEDIIVGDVLMGDDGTPRNVIELHSGEQQMYKIIPNVGDEQIVNANHTLYGKHRDYNKKTYTEFTMRTEDYYNMVFEQPRKKDSYKLVHSDKISFPHQEVPIDPYIFGFWLGDGNSDKARFTTEDQEIIDYLVNYGNQCNYDVRITDCENTKKCKHIYYVSKTTKNEFHEKLRNLNVLNNKHIPNCYLYNNREVLLQLLAGLIDSGGTYNKDRYTIEFTQCEERKHIVDQMEYICHLLGMSVSRDVRIPKERKLNGKIIKGGINQYRLKLLYGHSQIPSKLSRKQSIDRTDGKSKSQLDRLDTPFKIEKLGVGKYYGFSLDGNQLFLLKDFTVCHNSWPGLTTAIIQGQELCEVQGVPRGVMLFGGTGGTKNLIKNFIF